MLKQLIHTIYKAITPCIAVTAIFFSSTLIGMQSTYVKQNVNVTLTSGQQITTTRYNFETIGSTQTWSKEHPEFIPQAGWLVVTAKTQNAGIGTNQRTWHSPEGNIYVTFSTQLPNPLSVEQKLRIKQIASLAVVQTLEKLELKPQIKWSNDVLLNGKKISGVLDEIHDNILTIGIGLNINMNQKSADDVNIVCKNDPNRIPATSLFIEENRQFDMEEIFGELQKNFYNNMDLLFKGKFNAFVEEVASRLTCQKGNNVTIEPAQLPGCPKEPIMSGVFLGLNEYGSAIIDIHEKSVVINDGRMILISPK